MKETDVYWVAGLLEGEGCFYYIPGHLRVSLEMTDEDIVSRYAEIVGGTYRRSVARKPNWSDTYRCVISGARAVSLMTTIYPIMGQRRQDRISDIIERWDNRHAGKGDKYDERQILADFETGMSVSESITKYGFGRTTAYRYKNKYLASVAKR